MKNEYEKIKEKYPSDEDEEITTNKQLKGLLKELNETKKHITQMLSAYEYIFMLKELKESIEEDIAALEKDITK